MAKDVSGRVHYRSFWLLVLLLVVMLGVSSLFAVYTTRYAAESMEENLTIILTSNAKSKADSINLWMSTVLNNTERFVDKDMIRLFCAESILNTKAKSGNYEALGQLADMASGSESDLQNVRSIITQLLTAFLEESNYTAAAIWSSQMNGLLQTESFDIKSSEEYESLIQNTLITGKPSFSQVHDGLAGLTLTVTYPIFPPDYTELPAETAVAAIVLDVPLEAPFSKILKATDGQDDAPYRIFQWGATTGQTLQYLDLSTGKIIPYENWTTSVGQPLPLLERILPSGDLVYSIGMPIAGQNLIVTHEEPAHIAEDFYTNFRNFMVAFVVGSIVVTGLLLWGCWWFLVGRHERSVEESMRKLSEDVSTQQQIIDSINSTLTDGVVLTDTLGNIRYCNPSFAKMVEHDPKTILGFKMGSILNPDTAEILQNQIEQVVKSEGIFNFEEKFNIKGKNVYWQIVYTPYFGQSEELSGVVAVFRDATEVMVERETEQNRIDQLIQVLTLSIELVNPYLKGHSQVMGELADALAIRLRRQKDERKTITMAAALSQMGMLSLPKALINKKGALTEQERELMNTHVVKTCDILADFDFGLPVQETIAQMYENMDGSGYPNKLQGSDINFLSRILNVANTFCAILRPRIYRQACTLKDALNILNSNSAQYDPRVLDALNAFAATDAGREFVAKLQSKKSPT